MNKTLIIEVKDNSTIVTLATITSGSWSILFNKKYYFDFNNNMTLSAETSINYNIAWMEQMVEDIEKIYSIKEIDNTFLTINNSYSLLKAYKIKTSPNTNSDEVFEDVLKTITENNKNLKVMSMTLDNVEETPINKFYSFSYELVNKGLWEALTNYLKSFGVDVTKVVSSKNAIELAIKPYINRTNNLYNIQIEDNFTALHFIRKGNFIKSQKVNQGLNFIYKKISKAFNISLEISRKLFEKYGNIPPEAVIDNRIIFNGFDKDNNKIYFSKRDLSEVITKCVDEIFKDIRQYVSNQHLEDPEVVFSGKITRLKGFEKYAKETLKINKVNIFKTNIIGLELKTEIISIGVLYWVEDKIISQQNESGNLSVDRTFKKKKVFQVVLDKINKYYNYV